MIVVVDTSVVLRVLLGQADPVACWARWERAYVSQLVHTEFHRTVDRLRLEGILDDAERVRVALNFETFWRTCHRVPVSAAILTRAAEPFPTVLGTLDGIHLATVLLIRQNLGVDPTLLTHDDQLARAALASGVTVLP